MRLLDETKRLLREYGIHPRRSLGQNFCVNEKLLERMIAYANISTGDTVLEIGAGFGFLTHHLSQVAKRVIAVEVDPRLLKVLKESVRSSENIMIVEGDILKAELPSFSKVVANPPYSISSPLIKFLLKRSGLDCAVLTLQKEFAEKLVAQVGEREYGPLAVMAAHRAQVKVLEYLPRDSFCPQPEVESVVVSIKMCEPKFRVIDEGLFFGFVEYLFTQRDRKAKRPLESYLLREMRISKAEAKTIIGGLGSFIEKRVCDMKPEDFGELSNKAYPFLQGKRIVFKGHSFYVFPEVYQPSDDTFLIAERLSVEKGNRVLDMGTGCGILAVVAAEKARVVVAVDVNPYALRCAALNAELNHMADKVDVVLSDMFGAFSANTEFDLIIFNPPYLPTTEKIRSGDWLDRAWNGGRSGREVIDRFLRGMDAHIAKGGRMLMVQSSLSNPEESVKNLREMGFETQIIAEEELFFEKIVAILAKKPNITTA